MRPSETSVGGVSYSVLMIRKCKECGSDKGVREAIYGMPAFPLDEDKYYIAGCTTVGPKFVCVACGYGLEEIVPLMPDSGLNLE